MIARTRVTVEAGGRLVELASSPPLTVRRVHHDDPAVCGLCMVGSAAGPLPGDDVGFELVLRPGAQVALQAAGANIAQGRAGAPRARQRSVVTMDSGAALTATAPPLVVCAGADVLVTIDLSLADTATVAWREVVVLGRSGETGGAARIEWDVRRGGTPLLRQSLDLSDPGQLAWPGMLAGNRVIGTAFLAGPDLDARTHVADPTAVAQLVSPGAVLLTVLDDDAAAADKRLSELAEVVGGADWPTGRTPSGRP